MLRIKELRIEKNLSQEEVAKGINTSQRNIGRWENGENLPSSEYIILLADYFQCSTDFLLGRSDDFGNISVNHELSKDDEYLLFLFRKLPEIRKKTIIDTLEAMTERAERSSELAKNR